MRKSLDRVVSLPCILACSLLLVLAAAWPVQAAADEKVANIDAAQAEGKSAGDLSAAMVAARLVVEGENRKSPMMLLAAAELVGDMKLSSRDAEGIQVEVSGEAPPQEPPITLSMQSLIARARELAEDNAELASAVETAVERIENPSRGLVYRQGKDLPSVDVKGIVFKVLNEKHTRLDPGDEYTLSNVIFEARKPAIVGVVGDGDGDLDLWVYDDNGFLIGKDIDSTSICEVSWVPRYEGPFKIVIRNVGTNWERFVVLANW